MFSATCGRVLMLRFAEGVAMVLARLKSRFALPTPTGSPRLLRRFAPPDDLLTTSGVAVEQDAWRIAVTAPGVVRLFELPVTDVEACQITYRLRLRAEQLSGRAFLELWCRLPGRGEFFSKGLDQAVRGSVDWASYEVPFLLRRGQRPDLLKLNLAVEGTGTVWVKDVEVFQTPLQ
jgi:hypothetical protein